MDITLNGRRFATSKALSAFDQLRLARRLAPALPLVQGLVDPANAGKNKAVLTVLMLSQLSEQDSDYVIGKSLSVVAVEQSGKFVPLQSPAGDLMFNDVPMADLLELAVAVVEENVGDFFRTALGSLEAPVVAPT